MTTSMVRCNICEVPVLESTKQAANGSCIPCFKKSNYGFRPSDLDMLDKRGLTEMAIKWKELVKLGKPYERNPLKAEKLNDGYSRIYQYLENYFLIGDSGLNGNEILEILQELRTIENKEAKQLISKVEGFIFDLIKTNRNASES